MSNDKKYGPRRFVREKTVEDIAIEYDCRGERKTKTFDSAIKAKNFFKAQFVAKKNPTVINLKRGTESKFVGTENPFDFTGTVSDERIVLDPPGPNGGVEALMYYRDSDGNPVEKELATHVEAIELDENGKQIGRTYGEMGSFCVQSKPPSLLRTDIMDSDMSDIFSWCEDYTPPLELLQRDMIGVAEVLCSAARDELPMGWDENRINPIWLKAIWEHSKAGRVQLLDNSEEPGVVYVNPRVELDTWWIENYEKVYGDEDGESSPNDPVDETRVPEEFREGGKSEGRVLIGPYLMENPDWNLNKSYISSNYGPKKTLTSVSRKIFLIR